MEFKAAKAGRSRLPRRLRAGHDLALFLHDTIVAELKAAYKAEIFLTTFTPDDEVEAKELKDRTGEELWSWFEERGYYVLIAEVAYKQVMAAVATDMCHFVLESLRTSAKGKTAVAYALLRKPFKENLLILEWLLGDPEGFLEVFHGDSAQMYAPNRLPEEKRRAIVAAAVSKLPTAGMFNPDFLYDVRYSKRAGFSLEHGWTKATHLVTTMSGLETEPMNLNFVFSQEESIKDQWERYYEIVPFLLFYAVEVFETLLLTVADLESTNWAIDQYRRQFGFLLWSERRSRSNQRVEAVDEIINVLKAHVAITCDTCNSDIPVNRRTMEQVYLSLSVKCSECGLESDLSGQLYSDVFEVSED